MAHTPSLSGHTAREGLAPSTNVAATCDLFDLTTGACPVIYVNKRAPCESAGWGFLLKYLQVLLDAPARGDKRKKGGSSHNCAPLKLQHYRTPSQNYLA